MKGFMKLVAPLLALGGQLPEMKISAKDKRKMNDRRKNVPPRSMTDSEKEYYSKYKNLVGFVA